MYPHMAGSDGIDVCVNVHYCRKPEQALNHKLLLSAHL